MLIFCRVEQEQDDQSVDQQWCQFLWVLYGSENRNCNDESKGEDEEEFVDVFDGVEETLIGSEKLMFPHKLIFYGVVALAPLEEEDVEGEREDEEDEDDGFGQWKIEVPNEHIFELNFIITTSALKTFLYYIHCIYIIEKYTTINIHSHLFQRHLPIPPLFLPSPLPPFFYFLLPENSISAEGCFKTCERGKEDEDVIGVEWESLGAKEGVGDEGNKKDGDDVN